jgi:hypothetical protein
MDAALRHAQFEYDNRLPEADCDSALYEWIENGVEQLLLGGDVRFRRRLHGTQAVTFEQFAAAVDEFTLEQLSAPGISPSVLGRLVLSAWRKASSDAASAAAEVLNSPDPDEALRQIARTLLLPLAHDGLIAQAEEDEL